MSSVAATWGVTEERERALPRWFLPAYSGLVIAVYFLLALGSSVRVMKAGLACPDWPLCFGDVIPDYHPQVYFEFIHRVVAGLVAVSTVSLHFVLMRSAVARWLKVLAGFALVLLLTQIVFVALYMGYVNWRISRRPAAISKLLAQMETEEHQWSEAKILATAQSLFMRIQNAWCAQRLDELKALLHPDLYPSWETDIQNQIKRKEQNEMEALSINKLVIVDVHNTADDEMAAFTVCFDASSKDKIYRDGELYSEDNKPFREFWTFHWHTNSWQLYDVAQAGGWHRFMHGHLVYEKTVKHKIAKFRKAT